MRHHRKIIYLIGFLFTLPIALSSYINSSYLASFVSEKFVGIIYVFASLSCIVALLLAPKILRKIGSYRFLIINTLLVALSLFLFAFVKNIWAAIVIFIAALSLNTLVGFMLDELLKIFSRNESLGKIRGTYLSISHIAWIGSQVMYATFLGNFSFRTIYFFGFVIMMLSVIIAALYLKDTPDPQYDDVSPLAYVKNFFQNKNLARIYSLSFILQFFYSWMVIYTPIYLSAHLGFSWREIGAIFAVMLTPFVIMPIHLGKLADKIGERKILVLGFLTAAIATISIFFIHIHELYIWIILLFITRAGAASVDVMNDAYFFKHITPANEEFIGVYRSSSSLAYIVSPIIAFMVFLLVPSFNYIYLVLGVIMFLGMCLALRVKDANI